MSADVVACVESGTENCSEGVELDSDCFGSSNKAGLEPIEGFMFVSYSAVLENDAADLCASLQVREQLRHVLLERGWRHRGGVVARVGSSSQLGVSEVLVGL